MDKMTAEMAWQETDGGFVESDDPHFEEHHEDPEPVEDIDQWHE